MTQRQHILIQTMNADDTTMSYDDNHTLLTVNETADYLKVNPRTVRNYLVRSFGPLPHVKPAGRVMILKADLMRWLRGELKTKRRKVKA